MVNILKRCSQIDRAAEAFQNSQDLHESGRHPSVWNARCAGG